MSLIRVRFPGVYRRPEKNVGVSSHFWIGLTISGVLNYRTRFPDGTLCTEEQHAPWLTICAPGFTTEFEFGKNRENWVVSIACPSLHFDPEKHQIYLNYGGSQIPVRRYIPVDPAEVDSLRNEFRTLTDLYLSGIPVNQLESDLIISGLFRRFLLKSSTEEDAAELLRQRLIADVRWTRTITEHCRELGVSRDRIRLSFLEKFKIEPGEFRIRLRLQKILSLFASSRMNLKEIAFETGMKNPSHLSLFLRKRCGKTPTQLCREYRQTASADREFRQKPV